MLRFLAILLICCASIFGAQGDVTSFTIDANGYNGQAVINGLNTGGTFNFGLSANNTPGSSTPYLTVTDQGYDSAGAAVARTRKVYLTKQMRQPYNQDANIDYSYSAPNLTARISLSGPIFQKSSTNLTLTAASGWYAQGGTNATTTTALSVTDNSTLAYPVAIGKWKQANFDVITNSSYRVYFSAYHRFGVSAVVFTATDAHSHTVTSTQTSPRLDDRTFPGSGKIRPSWYIADIDCSSFTQGDTITVNAKVYPYIGDSGSILDTGDGVYSMPTPYHCPLTLLCNRTGAIAYQVAAVDPTNGSDTTGVVVSNTFSSTAPFLTIAGAGRAIVNTNTLHGRAHLGYSYICLTNANHNWVGASLGYGSYGGIPDTWCTIQNYPSGSGATINGQSGNFHLQNGSDGKLHFKGITITAPADTFDTYGYAWVDGCTLNSSAANGIFFGGRGQFWTFNTVGASGWKQGFTQASTQNDPPILTLGNDLTGNPSTDTAQLVYNVSGNYGGPTTTGKSKFGHNGSSCPKIIEEEFSFNYLSLTNGGGTTLSLHVGTDGTTNAIGAAIVNNVIECIGDSGSDIAMVIAADGASSATDPVNNILIWGNTIVGNRMNYAYNDTGSSAPVRKLWSVWGNIMDVRATKHDTFTGGGGANGVRTNGWPLLFGVGQQKNLFTEGTGITGVGSFMNEFSGLFVDAPAASGQPPGSTSRALTYVSFVNRQSFTGSSGTGGGNYHLNNISPAVLLDDTFCPLLFDIEGVYRGAFDPPGAYSSSSPRRGGGFF